MNDDPSNGWEEAAGRFIRQRSDIGTRTVLAWASSLPAGASILDLGCGSGRPIAFALVGSKHALSGVDASPTLADAFRRNIPGAPIACEAAEESAFFDRRFDGIIAIGLVFLLREQAQRRLIRHVARALVPGGRFLFSAPEVPCEWPDLLTGRPSRSLGAAAYRRMLEYSGMQPVGSLSDEGGNFYLDAIRTEGP